MKKENLKWLAANILNFPAGLMIGLGCPIGYPIISQALDIYYFFVPGVLLLAISAYYKFVKKY